MKRRRIWELDFARGFAIIMMIFDHLMYDFCVLDSTFSNYNQINNPVIEALNVAGEWYWSSGLRFYGHMFFIALFLIVSGISFTFSKNNLSRSLKLLVVAALITLVTLVIEKLSGLDVLIVFGVIHMFAVSVFLTYLVRKIWDNDLFVFTLGLIVVAIGISIDFWSPTYHHSLSWDMIPGMLLGTTGFGADYFGLFPYWGVILIGTAIGNIFYQNKTSLIPNLEPKERNIVLWTGRNSLVIFVTHQFVLYGLMFIIGYILGYRL